LRGARARPARAGARWNDRRATRRGDRPRLAQPQRSLFRAAFSRDGRLAQGRDELHRGLRRSGRSCPSSGPYSLQRARPARACAPDGKRIVFESDRSGYGDLYVMNADGGTPRRLTRTAALDFSPSWSPDGSRIAFVSNLGGNLDLYTIRTDGRGLRRLTSAVGFDLYPSWSPNGKQIVFASSRDIQGGRISEIYVMDADGRNAQRLTHNLVDDWLPSWSPDGRH